MHSGRSESANRTIRRRGHRFPIYSGNFQCRVPLNFLHFPSISGGFGFCSSWLVLTSSNLLSSLCRGNDSGCAIKQNISNFCSSHRDSNLFSSLNALLVKVSYRLLKESQGDPGLAFPLLLFAASRG